MLKNNVSGYKDNNTLENAIVKYKEVTIKVIEAESQIKIKTENNGEEKKNESLTHLRIVIGVLPVIKNCWNGLPSLRRCFCCCFCQAIL